ncbi:hypothetical protein KIW84_014895 [Lathyrus oleraceus]|uniref:Uncharacterized protein n=1 Tax=Pisum sativum TaxID=3888 RepID=A0A9D5BP97_PEA|nr:hypothetical protein KIW84_014895 [Pisum sativum]
MLTGSNTESAEIGFAANQNSESRERNLKPVEDREEEEEEEEEDADFNPLFLKETLSDASSSLSSEGDGLGGNVVDSGPSSMGIELEKITTNEVICSAVDSEHGEEEISLRPSGIISQSESDKEKNNDLISGTSNGFGTGGVSNTPTKSQGPIVDIDNEDAICMRTRARYSLEGFSLDELETFLQETDDEDDHQNVDDEEEYKKFLAAVLQGGEGDDGISSHENVNPDEDDEDNDADFELELEELLESDGDDNAAAETRNKCDGAGRRPETRQNKRRKTSSQCERRILGQASRPLRPLLPCWINGHLASGNRSMPDATLCNQSSASRNGFVNGFTPQQIGQLHCLIHEHVQLLIQVFSLSVLDPSHKQVASQAQSLLFEMLRKRDAVLASTRTPYPAVCFTPYFSCTSVSNGISNAVPGQCNTESASTQDAMNARFPQSHQTPSEGLNGQRRCFQDTDGSFWFPFVRGPVQSILDVAPLNLLRGYVDDINSGAQEFRKRYIESGYDLSIEKEPLFPFSSSAAGANSEVSSRTISGANNTVSFSPGKQQPKKSLAAMLVESTKKQSIALVPKEVANSTQRFLAFFNPALFPHKPPPAAVVNRMLFTDSEDELLALGILEYNTDWEAIQQRFLPSKSTHQIFVRQKNRCSSKSSDNPIKAVRRMKTSPLTAEEIAGIHEGLKHYKSDWMSVWQYIVPHRDPFLLPRQWRVALGTQKSYKVDDSKKEKRRLYESERRKSKATTAIECWQSRSDKEDFEAEIADGMDYSDVPYVHQAFLADWRPDMSTLNYSEHISPTSVEVNLGHDSISQDIQLYRGISNYGLSGNIQHQNGSYPAFPSVHKPPLPFHSTSDFRSGMKGAPSAAIHKNPVFGATSSAKYYCRPYRARRANSARLVKLAPDLPPVNLPPSVRVVSETAFKGFQCGTSKVCPRGDGVTNVRKDNSASQVPHSEKVMVDHHAKHTRPMPKDSVIHSQLERSETAEGRSVVAEKATYVDLQMHPLLFQVTEEGNTPYYPFKFSSGPSSSFSFFSGRQPQLNLSLFNSSQQQGHIDRPNTTTKSKNSSLRLGGIDFHPLLQKSNDTQAQTGSDAIQAEPLVSNGVPDTTNRSFDLNDKSNELDLEIHLSSLSESEKSMKSIQLKEHDPIESQKTVASCATEMSAPICQQSDRIPSPRGCELASTSPLVVPDDNITGCDVDNVGEQSHPEIVMEQEELSDSEEDIEEHVEFECEEMADSEGEDGSGFEQAPGVQNKFECEEMADSEEEDGSGCEQAPEVQNKVVPRANSDIQVDSSPPTKNAMPNTALNSMGMDDKSSSSWLSLDSSRSETPVLSKAVLQRVTTGEASASRNFKIFGKAVAKEGHTVDTVQPPNLVPRVFNTPRKPRKRRSKLNANIGLTVKKIKP